MGITKSNQLTIGKVDEQVAYNKETNTLELGTNVEVDGDLNVNGEIIVGEKVKKLFDYYDVDEMFETPLETTIKDLMLKALGLTSFNPFSLTNVYGIFKMNTKLLFGNFQVANYGNESYSFNLYDVISGSYINNGIIGSNFENIKLEKIIYNDDSFSGVKVYEYVGWQNNQIYSKKDIQHKLLLVDTILAISGSNLVLELVKYTQNEIILITKDIRYDDLVCYITEYTFKTIVGDEENYSLTVRDDISVVIDHP